MQALDTLRDLKSFPSPAGRLKEALKEDLGRPAPGQGHEAHAFLEVAVAGQEFESRLDESLRILAG